MDWQSVLVVLALFLALAYLGRRVWRTWGAKGGCGGGCGCGSSAQGTARKGDTSSVTMIPLERLTLRTRPPGGAS